MFGPQADKAQLEILFQYCSCIRNRKMECFQKTQKNVYFIQFCFMYLEIQFPGGVILMQIYYFIEIIHFGKHKLNIKTFIKIRTFFFNSYFLILLLPLSPIIYKQQTFLLKFQHGKFFCPFTAMISPQVVAYAWKIK